MRRYRTIVEDGSVYVEGEDERLEIGTVDDIHELAGGETYELVYEGDHAKAVEWLELDDEEAMTIDVIETIAAMDYPEPFVGELRERSHEKNGDGSERTAYFVDIMTDIWDNKGNLDHLDENPFR